MVGVMPAARVMARTSPVCSWVINVMTVPARAGARRTTGAVQVGLVLGGRVGVHDQGDVVHVDAARRDVGGDQGARLAGVERVHVAGPRALAEVAVQLDRRHAAAVELAGQGLGAVLGAREDDGAAGCAGQVDQHRHALLTGEVQDVVVHRGDRRLRRVGLVGDGLLEELLDQDVDALVERGREQQPLAVLRSGGEESAYGGQEPEVGHVVGLVQHGDLDGAEVAVTLLDEVLEAAGAGEDDVDATAQALDLRVLADAAEDGAGA